MNLNAYRYVIAIAENASISKAAKELFITQPALTKYLNNLEDELHIQLFDRTVNPIQITYAGEIYVQEGRTILELHKRLDQKLAEISQLQRGQLSLGINSERGSWCLPILVPAFRKRYPGIELKIYEGHSQYLEDEILKNHIDLAIGTLPFSSPGLDFEYLAEEPIILAMTQKHPIAQEYDLSLNSPFTPYYLAPERLNGQDMIALVREQGMGRIAYQFLARHGINPNITMILKNNKTALRMASAGTEMVFALAGTAERDSLIAPMAWFTIENPVFCRRVVAYYRQSLGLSPAAQKFVSLYKELSETEPALMSKSCQVILDPPRSKRTGSCSGNW